MNKTEMFNAVGEYFAAGFYEDANAPYATRHARALRRSLENVPVPEYEGRHLYPASEIYIWNPGWTMEVFYHHSNSIWCSENLTAKVAKVFPDNAFALKQAETCVEEFKFLTTNGGGYTHSVIDYEQVLQEGFNGYLARINAKYDSDPVFYGALREVLEALCAYVRRCVDSLRGKAPNELVAALEHVPFEPARNFYEAILAYNFLWYIDGLDSGGRGDKVLSAYPQPDNAFELLHDLWLNYNACSGWHVLLDSQLPLAQVAVRAQCGLRRPNSGILVDGDTPQEIWDAIFDSWSSGTVSPALYSRPNYKNNVGAVMNVSDEDVDWFCFGGCTELMIQGRSNTGSLDADVKVLQVFEQTVIVHPDFETYYNVLMSNIRRQIDFMAERVRRNHEFKAFFRPQLIRTLFTRDCIEKGRDFNAGGARYNSSVINVPGLVNLVNSVYAVKQAYLGKLSVTPRQLAEALETNFRDNERLRSELKALPKYGNDITDIDLPSGEIITQIFRSISSHSTAQRSFVPAVIMFNTHVGAGSRIGATPDGRHDGDPLADSFGPMPGTDSKGPTASLNSATAADQSNALGTLVMNLRLNKSLFSTTESRAKLKALLLGYFANGGLQIQPTVVDSATLTKALESPEDFPDLMVRVGGFSEYFNRLSREIQLDIIKRTEHEL